MKRIIILLIVATVFLIGCGRFEDRILTFTVLNSKTEGTHKAVTLQHGTYIETIMRNNNSVLYDDLYLIPIGTEVNMIVKFKLNEDTYSWEYRHIKRVAPFGSEQTE